MDWKDNFKEGSELILATCSPDGIPNANVVISLGFIDDKLLVADCQMTNTIQNLKNNWNICVIGKYIRLKGKTEILSSGEIFDICVQISKSHDANIKVNNAILISISEVFDLDNLQKIL